MNLYTYTKKDWENFKQGQSREWVITNGLGGYGGRTLIDSQSRTHHGYLTASLHSPTMRYLIFSHMTEKIGNIHLETAQFYDGERHYAEGFRHLKQVTYDGTITFEYQHKYFRIIKEIALERNKNTCAVYYQIENKTRHALDVNFTPYFNFREHNTNTIPSDFNFKTKEFPGTFLLSKKEHPDHVICFSYSNGLVQRNVVDYKADYELQIEVDLEKEGLDSHYCPITVSSSVPPLETKEISFTCSLLKQEDVKYHKPITDTTSYDIVRDARDYYFKRIKQTLSTPGLEEKCSPDDLTLLRRLTVACDHFICHRDSTNTKTVLAGLPWFTDWGRDTMIAFTGLTLCTQRFDEAREILSTFAQYIKNGLVPNMFPDNDTPPLYNTVDASLWFFYAVKQYLTYTKGSGHYEESLEFIKQEIYPGLKQIQQAYETGTDFNIGMDTDGLIHAGSDYDQITWMDVRVDDWVPTPRHGKPVEINALWYNALKIMEELSSEFGEDSSHYTELSLLVKENFHKRFWNTKDSCLYDVVDEGGTDVNNAMLRPNQIFAVSLPYPLLDDDKALKIVERVKDELYIGCGLRSLSPYDPEYHGIYTGALKKRDAAYHQGTAWGFLLGPFITAYRKVNHYDEQSREMALLMLEKSKYHLEGFGCIGSISEIFDGDAPHTPRGCYAQAWSVGELMRCFLEDLM